MDARQKELCGKPFKHLFRKAYIFDTSIVYYCKILFYIITSK